MTYAEKLKDPRWQKKRLEILNRDGWACQWCGDKDITLHVHHEYYVKGENPWDANEWALTTVCEECHSTIHLAKTPLERFLFESLRSRVKYEPCDENSIKLLNRVMESVVSGKLDF